AGLGGVLRIDVVGGRLVVRGVHPRRVGRTPELVAEGLLPGQDHRGLGLPGLPRVVTGRFLVAPRHGVAVGAAWCGVVGLRGGTVRPDDGALVDGLPLARAGACEGVDARGVGVVVAGAREVGGEVLGRPGARRDRRTTRGGRRSGRRSGRRRGDRGGRRRGR